MKEIFFKENIFDILDYLEEGIQIIDQKGKIIYFNRAAQRLEGLSSEMILGRDLLEIYPSLSLETSTLMRVLKEGKSIFDMEQTFINYKGHKITTLNTSLPIKSMGKMIGAIEIARDRTKVRELSEKIVDLQSELVEKTTHKHKKKQRNLFTTEDIVGESLQILRVKELVKRAAKVDSPILVYGETGTGKELVVQSIHSHGNRKGKPFIAQNCAALPNTLLEGILFGTTKGAFTGSENREGLFEIADGGTLFLDEINSMPLELQAKILRVIQDGRIRRVGATQTKDVDVRIVAAMNVLPEIAVETKQLRRDLYYRLGVIHIELPKLKERDNDVLLLSKHFIDKMNNKYGTKFECLDEAVEDVFLSYDWPGNIRELENMLESVVNLYPEFKKIEVDHLPKHLRKEVKFLIEEVKNIDLDKKITELEIELISKMFIICNGNVSKTAKNLNIPRQTLQYKIKKYNIDMPKNGQ